jgi:regulator of replication initiation timing
MFISNDEKKYLFDQIKALAKEQSHMSSEITVLKGKLKAAEGNIFVLKQIVDMNRISSAIEKTKPKKPKTEAQKAKQAEYMRKYTAKKRAEKLALEQK